MCATSVEIERVFLLKKVPPIPPDAVAYTIQQGYLPRTDEPGGGDGRLRKMTCPDGSVLFTHTVKKGTGMVRIERERAISCETFERGWSRTTGRRLTKRRYAIESAGHLWEIDVFDDLDLVLAEVELPSPVTPLKLPDWLAPHVIREVTEEPAFRNYNLARELAR